MSYGRRKRGAETRPKRFTQADERGEPAEEWRKWARLCDETLDAASAALAGREGVALAAAAAHELALARAELQTSQTSGRNATHAK